MTTASTEHGDDDAETAISLAKLIELRAAFSCADHDHSMALDEPEFIAAFSTILVTDVRRIRRLFARIDNNSDGQVTWDEFTNYLFLESHVFEASFALHPLPADTKDMTPAASSPPVDARLEVGRARDGMIEKVLLLPSSERYVTACRDGTVRVWSASQVLAVPAPQAEGGPNVGGGASKAPTGAGAPPAGPDAQPSRVLAPMLLRTVQVALEPRAALGLAPGGSEAAKANTPVRGWVGDLAEMPFSNRIAAVVSDRTLALIGTANWEVYARIVDLSAAPLSVCCLSEETDPEGSDASGGHRVELLLVGDMRGVLTLIDPSPPVLLAERRARTLRLGGGWVLGAQGFGLAAATAAQTEHGLMGGMKGGGSRGRGGLAGTSALNNGVFVAAHDAAAAVSNALNSGAGGEEPGSSFHGAVGGTVL
ncbi:hypothetical protein T492DRAFT_180754 [Pavlovales sp. CCMP2436]|nr:hypothetical protein T492DRAFT_180754 [Pavlovales sp. CCMP2436]